MSAEGGSFPGNSEQDMYAYNLDIAQAYAPRIQRLLDRCARDLQCVIRPVEKRHFARQMRQVLEIFRDAWAENWGYVRPTNAEVDHLIDSIKLVLAAAATAEIDKQLAGFMVVLPNINELTQDLNGRLLQLGWLKLLWRLQFASFQSVRVPLMGITQAFQKSSKGAALAMLMIDHCRQHFIPQGITHCEMSWILKSNAPMRGILEASGSLRDKTYRIYGMPIA